MKILVIDNNPVHQKSAHDVFKGDDYDLTVVGDHESAIKEIGNYPKAEKYFDAVLCDMMMPVSDFNDTLVAGLIGKEESVGWALVIRAAMNGAKYVAVISDANHHSCIGSACLDAMHYEFFTIAKARALFTNYPIYTESRGKDWKRVLDQLVGDSKFYSRGR